MLPAAVQIGAGILLPPGDSFEELVSYDPSMEIL
jgi:hypothetical protein